MSESQMIYNWAEEVRDAFRFEKNTCILAGAGTGKTSALVEQYLALLSGETALGPLNVEQIVAITFTEKAAAEMKERIHNEIEKKIAPSHPQGPESVSGGEQMWQEAWRKLFGANITTIHSFCARVLRENPVEARIDPGFGVLDDQETRVLLERVIKQRVISGVQEENPHTIRLVSDYELRRPGTYAVGLIEILINLLTNIRTEGISLDQIERYAQRADKQARERLPLSIQSLKDTFAELKTALRDEGKEDRFAMALEKWPSLEKKLKLSDWELEDLITEAFPNFLSSLKYRGKIPRIKEPIEKIRSILNRDDKGKGYEDNLPRLYSQLQSKEVLTALTALLRDIDLSYAKEKARTSMLDFDDLQIHTRDLLRSSPRVRERYQRLYQVIMVDEFQDTNDIQREIIYYLSEDPKYLARLKPQEDYRGKIRLGDNRLFVVGDPKQSIYCFRGADVSVFLDVMEEVEKRGKKFFLRENRRSLPPLINFTNALFSELMSAPGEFGEESHLIPVRSKEEQIGVEFLLVSLGKDSDEKRQIEARAIANRILQLVGNIDIFPKSGEKKCAKFGDIAILFRAMTKSHIYERELRRRNIPYYTVRGGGFYGCQEIKDLLNVLQAVESDNAEIGLAGFLRSPMVGLSDETLYQLRREGGSLYSILSPDNLTLASLNEEEQEKVRFARGLLQELKAAKDRLSSAELIARVLEGTGYSALLLTTFQGEQKVANLHKLIEVARNFEGKEIFTFHDFVRHLENLVNEESREQEAQIFLEGSDCVQLMSIHQAKGLEFPIVFIADLDRSPSKGPSGNVIYSKAHGIAVKLREVTGGEFLNTSLYDKVTEEARRKEEAENRRLFYVATTRARDHLVLSGPIFNSRSKNTWAAQLRDFLSDYSQEITSFLADPEPSTLSLRIKKPGPSTGGYTIDLLLSKAERVEEKRKEESRPLIQEYPEIEKLKSLPQPFTKPIQAQAAKILTQACEFHPGPRKDFSISATALSSFIFCQRKFYYTEVLGLTEFPLTVRKAGLPPMEAGSLVHRILEKLDLSLTGEALSTQLDELFQQDPHSLRAGTDELKQMKKAIQAFIESEPGTKISHSPAVFRELPIMLKLSEDSFSLFIHGIADILFHESGKQWTVMDYKYTTQSNESPGQYRAQLLIYALAVYEALPEEVRVRTAIKFLKDHGSPPVDLNPGPEELNSFKQSLIKEGKELSQMITVINEELWEKKEEKPAPGGCQQRYCRFRSRCYPEG